MFANSSKVCYQFIEACKACEFASNHFKIENNKDNKIFLDLWAAQ